MTALQRTAAAGRRIGVSAGLALAFNIPGGMNIDVRTAALAAGWDGLGKVTATVTANVGSTSIGTSALVVAGAFPAGVEVVVASGVYVVGKGGYSHGNGTSGSGNAENGGPALSVSVPVTVTNNGIIGGGGGAGAYNVHYNYAGGGGAGLTAGASGLGANGTLTNGGAWAHAYGGNPGQNGGNAVGSIQGGGGAGGGGLGGAGGSCDGFWSTNGDYENSQNPGDSGDANDYYDGTTQGGAAGAAVLGNANITWAVNGTRYGPLNS